MKHKSKATISILLTLVMVIVMSFSALGTAVADTTALTREEAGFLSLLDYDNAENLGKYLAGDIGNRYTASFRRDIAAEFIIDKLESYGYEPYIQGFTTGSTYLNGCLEVGGIKYVYDGPTYATTSVYRFTNNKVTITGATVLNWTTTTQALPVPAGSDFGGKAVFVTTAAAPSAANYYNACVALQNAGAGAVIFEWFPPAANGNTSYSRIGNTTSGTAITIPVGNTLYHETHAMLSSLGDGSAVTLTMEARNDGKNVIASLPSSTGTLKTVYVTAHYDSQLSTPGMNDNASGVMMTLEMARAFKKLSFEYNIVFILFDAEEQGLLGAYAFCRNMTNEERANFVANYNMDMICTSQEDCIHFFLNISDTALRTYETPLASNQRLIDVPQAVEIAKQYDIFNHSYLAAQKTGFDMSKFNICLDTTTDHYAFVVEATRAGNNYPNMRNAVEYDWRRNEKGTSFETLYHRVGDTYEINFSRERLEKSGNLIALAIYYSALGNYTDKTDLIAVIAAFEDLIDINGLPLLDYTNASWDAAYAAYAGAAQVYVNGFATQDQVDAATVALSDAIGNLQIKQNISLDSDYNITAATAFIDDDYFITEYAIRNDSDNDGEMIIVAAIYDKRGVMIAIVMEFITIPKGSVAAGTISIAIPSGYDPSEVTMKTFIWEGVTWCPIALEVCY